MPVVSGPGIVMVPTNPSDPVVAPPAPPTPPVVATPRDAVDPPRPPPMVPAPDANVVDRYVLGPVKAGTIEEAILRAMGSSDRVFTCFHAAIHAACFDLNATYRAGLYPKLTPQPVGIPGGTLDAPDERTAYETLYSRNMRNLLPRALRTSLGRDATPTELDAAFKALALKRGIRTLIHF